MEFNACKDDPTVKINNCSKGHKAKLVSEAIWDDPGDCKPLIDHYVYYVTCNVCGIRTHPDNENVDDAIRRWNKLNK